MRTSRREFLGRAGMMTTGLMAATLPTPLWAQRKKPPTDERALAVQIREQFEQTIRQFKAEDAAQSTVAEHLAALEKIRTTYQPLLEGAGLHFSMPNQQARLQSLLNGEDTDQIPWIVFQSWDLTPIQLTSKKFVVRLVLGFYNPHPIWMHGYMCKVGIGEANMVEEKNQAALARFDRRFPVLSEPGFKGETPGVPHDPRRSPAPFVLPPVVELNPPGQAYGMILPPQPISICSEKPYEFPPAFRPVGYTLVIPGRSEFQDSTNYAGHCFVFKLRLQEPSPIVDRATFVFRA